MKWWGIIATAILIPLVVWASPYKLTAQGLTLGDDVGATWGASKDTTIVWETADADQHYGNVVVTGSSDLVVSQDAEIDWGITGANGLRVQSADSDSKTEYIRMRHDGANALIENPVGFLKLEPDDYVTINYDARPATGGLSMYATAEAGIFFNEGISGVTLMASDFTRDQFVLGLGANNGRQFILTDYSNRRDDHGHASAETNPTLFVHSAQGAVAEDEYVGIWHDQTDANIKAGEGDIKLTPGTGTVVQRMEYWVSCQCNQDEATKACITVQDGDVITAILTDTTTTWDDPGGPPVDHLDLGDGDDADGFADDPQTVDNWNLVDADDRGEYLWNGGGKYQEFKVYQGADTIDCTISDGGGSNGETTVWIRISRLG